MSEKLPAVKSREVISALGKLGFRETRRSKGSHVQLADDSGRRVTVPARSGADICCGLMQKIIQSAGVSKEQFIDALR